MEINTTFSIGDKAYVIHNDDIHEVKINSIRILFDGRSKIIKYEATLYIPVGILKVNEDYRTFKEEDIFLDIEEAKKELALKKKYENKYPLCRSAYLSGMQGATVNPYYITKY